MSRLFAIAMLCAFFCFPAFASEQEGLREAGQPAPAAAAQELTDLPPEIFEKLVSDLVAEILLSLEESQMIGVNGSPPAFGQVAIAVPLAFFMTILLVVIATLVVRYRKHAQTQETLRLMIEKGAEIPPEFLTPPVSQYGDLRRGLILVGVGLSLSIAIGLTQGVGGGGWTLGLIPLFIGAGYLIVWRYSQRAETH